MIVVFCSEIISTRKTLLNFIKKMMHRNNRFVRAMAKVVFYFLSLRHMSRSRVKHLVYMLKDQPPSSHILSSSQILFDKLF